MSKARLVITALVVEKQSPAAAARRYGAASAPCVPGDAGCVTLRVAGKLRHIGIGRPHAGTHVLLLVSDLHVRVINAATGDLLRELDIDPTRDYQPRRSRHPETTTAEPTKP
jgi:hypothetical protein